MEQAKIKAEFIWDKFESTLKNLEQKKISSEQAKAAASLLKQGNNVLAFQLDVAKYINQPDRKGSMEILTEVGL